MLQLQVIVEFIQDFKRHCIQGLQSSVVQNTIVYLQNTEKYLEYT